MPTGIKRDTNFKSITFKLRNGTVTEESGTNLPTSLTNANSAYKHADAIDISVRSDYDVLTYAAPDTANNITWRESGKSAEQYTDDITAAPSSPPTFDLELSAAVDSGNNVFTATSGGTSATGDGLFELMQKDATSGAPADVGTYALLFINIVQQKGKGTGADTIGRAAAGANEPDQGLLVVQRIKHNGVEVNTRTADVTFFTLRGVQFLGARVFNYGTTA